MATTLRGAPPSARRSLLAVLPPIFWLLTVGLLLGALVLNIYGPLADGDPTALVFVPLVVIMIGSFATVGALLAVRRPRNPIGWLFVLAAPMLALALFVQAFVAQVVGTAAVPTSLLIGAQIASVLFQPALVTAGLVVLVFPDGRLPRWGGIALSIVLIGMALSSTSQLLLPGSVFGRTDTANPLGQPALVDLLHGFEAAGNTLLVVGFALTTLLLALRFRSADEVERKQLKWFAYVAVVLAVALAVASIEAEPISGIAWIIAFAAFAALPIAIAIAVMRYRLYDIDVLVNRTLVYVPLLALLGGLFAAGITFFERLFLALTGDESDVGIVLATLIVAMAFEPLRRQLETVVDRRFKPANAAVGVADSASGSAFTIGDPALDAYVESVVRRVLEEKR